MLLVIASALVLGEEVRQGKKNVEEALDELAWASL